jgi:hypothetical protein
MESRKPETVIIGPCTRWKERGEPAFTGTIGIEEVES